MPISNSKGIMSRNLKASSRPEEEGHVSQGHSAPRPGLLAGVLIGDDGTQQCFMSAKRKKPEEAIH